MAYVMQLFDANLDEVQYAAFLEQVSTPLFTLLNLIILLTKLILLV